MIIIQVDPDKWHVLTVESLDNEKTCKNPLKVMNPQPKKKPDRSRVDKPTTSVAPSKKQVRKFTNMGADLYIDPGPEKSTPSVPKY